MLFGFDVLRIFLSHFNSGSQPKVKSNVILKSYYVYFFGSIISKYDMDLY